VPKACWTLINLAVHQEWREKCKKEIQDLLSRHLGDSNSFATTSGQLSAIPLSAFDDELPILDACIRESQRIAFTNVMVRRNVRGDINIDGKVINHGDFLTYSAREVHLNPEYYPEPHKYDPGRWLRPDPVPKTVYPFLAWGAGRHPCAGMKLAKSEMKWMVVMFLMRYEYELVDSDGRLPDPLPVPNVDDPKVLFDCGENVSPRH
jgi:cytochrome P450